MVYDMGHVTRLAYYINYQYTALNDIKPEMIAEATRNARQAADQFAEDSKSDRRRPHAVCATVVADIWTPYKKVIRQAENAHQTCRITFLYRWRCGGSVFQIVDGFGLFSDRSGHFGHSAGGIGGSRGSFGRLTRGQ